MAFRFRSLIAFGALGAALLPLAALLGRFETAGDPWPRFLLLYGAVAAMYLSALGVWSSLGEGVRRSRRLLLFVLAVAVLVRAAIFPLAASDDVHRYLWEGRLQHLGGNPYRISPADAAHHYPEARTDPFLPGVNHPELTTIYPPGAELLFFLFTGLAYDLAAWKAFVLGADLVLIALLLWLLALRREPLSAVVRYAWHPLPWIAFVGEGHVDLFLLLLTVVGWILLEQGKRWGAGLAFSASIATKLVSAVYLPALVRRTGVGPLLIGIAGMVLLIWPYREAGWGLVRVVGRFGWRMGHNGSFHAVLGWATDPQVARLIALVPLLAAAIWVWHRNGLPMKGALHLTGILLLLSPTVHPWYATWLLPILVCHPVKSWLLLTLTVGIAYAAYGVRTVTGEFYLPVAMRVAEWLPVYALFTMESLRAARER